MDGWMASPTQWMWVWASFGSWQWTGKPGMWHSMGLQRVGHNWKTELTDCTPVSQSTYHLYHKSANYSPHTKSGPCGFVQQASQEQVLCFKLLKIIKWRLVCHNAWTLCELQIPVSTNKVLLEHITLIHLHSCFYATELNSYNRDQMPKIFTMWSSKKLLTLSSFF